MIKVVIEFEKIELHKDDIDNLECNFCDRALQSLKEVWYESDTENTILSICGECLEKYKLKL